MLLLEVPEIDIMKNNVYNATVNGHCIQSYSVSCYQNNIIINLDGLIQSELDDEFFVKIHFNNIDLNEFEYYSGIFLTVEYEDNLNDLCKVIVNKDSVELHFKNIVNIYEKNYQYDSFEVSLLLVKKKYE